MTVKVIPFQHQISSSLILFFLSTLRLYLLILILPLLAEPSPTLVSASESKRAANRPLAVTAVMYWHRHRIDELDPATALLSESPSLT